jgi:hypothetical protein
MGSITKTTAKPSETSFGKFLIKKNSPANEGGAVFAFIAIVKKTFRLREVFLLQPLMPPSLYSEYIYDKRYNRPNRKRANRPTVD